MKYLKLFEDIDLYDDDWNWDEEKEIDDHSQQFKGHENFYNFLVEKNILDLYARAFSAYKYHRYLNDGQNIGKRISIKKFLDIEKERNYISQAFPFNKIYLVGNPHTPDEKGPLTEDEYREHDWNWINDDWMKYLSFSK